ncbi:C3HC zinc finger-like-domain-containing protein [Mycena galopus ATCC 62051]|nr:C3HC zinc finger-like-domain-containing protein [Mycena galopus ATCC 62051]
MSATTSASGSAAMSEPSGSTTADTVGSRATATKRKLADAFQSLDAATEAAGPPTKKAHTGRSLYATLAKYGVKTKQAANPQFASLSKGTPHLTAILARAATRTRKALPFASSSAAPLPPLPATAEYRPSSIPSFLARLATFKLATYANKPPQLDAVAAAKCGWTNDGKDRLVCGFCAVSWDAANALVERQRLALVSAHKNGCPWRENQCDASIYRIPLQAPAVMIREIKTTAAVLDPVMQQMEVKHPLTASQLASLAATVSAFTLPAPEEGATPPPDPSETAILTALFGWAPAPPTAPDRPRVSSLSRPSSRATSRAGSPFSASTPPRLARSSTLATSTTAVSSLSASTSVSDLATTSTPGPAPPSTPPRQFLRRVSSAASPLARRDNTTTSLLHCALCQRRIGLWAFAPPPAEPSTPPPKSRLGPTADGQAVPISERARAPAPQRHFDLLKEHRSFCPYVVRSTVVPSLPAADAEVGRASTSSAARPSTSSSVGGNGTLEGWRAVLTVVLRYGLGQRQRERAAAVRRRVSTQSMEGGDGDSAMDVDAVNGNGEGEDAAVDNVEAMVESVKVNGGKDYLRYVRRLLG